MAGLSRVVILQGVKLLQTHLYYIADLVIGIFYERVKSNAAIKIKDLPFPNPFSYPQSFRLYGNVKKGSR
jgi:hypothetical protein